MNKKPLYWKFYNILFLINIYIYILIMEKSESGRLDNKNEKELINFISSTEFFINYLDINKSF